MASRYDWFMETWIRSDGRYQTFWLDEDLFGLVVIVLYGGDHHCRHRLIPVESEEAGACVMERLGKRRRAHGYTLEGMG